MKVAIRVRTGGDDEEAVSLLGEGGAAQVRGAHGHLLHANLNAELLEATSFKQKGVILAALGVFTGSDVTGEFDRLYARLRNPLMHASPFVADSIDGLRGFAVDLAVARSRTQDAIDAAA